MVETLRSMRGGGGSVKVGATGTISSLMMRELESTKSLPRKSGTPKYKSSTLIPSVISTPRRQQQRKSLEESSTDRNYNSVHSKSFGNSYNTKASSRNVHRIPMLSSDDIYMDGNNCREKPERKGLRSVAIVDVRCNNPDKAWASRPLNRLRKLGFSKLSETFA